MIVVDPSKPRGIVWLASYPRSGNTWTRIFLARLIQILSGQAVDEVEFAKGMKFAVGDSQVALYQGWLQRPAFQNSPADVAKARLPALKSIVEHSPGIVPMKTHNANVALFDVRLMSPEISAGAVYIVRNPLDVAISLAHFNSDTIDDAIAMMGTSGYASAPTEKSLFELRGSWSEHVHTWTAVHDDSLLVVRYEDMLAEPMETFGAIAKHTMMNCTDDQLRQAIASFVLWPNARFGSEGRLCGEARGNRPLFPQRRDRAMADRADRETGCAGDRRSRRRDAAHGVPRLTLRQT